MIGQVPYCENSALILFFAGLIAGIATFSTASLAKKSPDSLAAVDCEAELDAIVSEVSNDAQNLAPLEDRLENLVGWCHHLPQINHNRGVLAARTGRWPDAIAHFESALALDKRAAMTHRHLQQIFEYRAASAYARALGSSQPIVEPVFELQDSTTHNADALSDAKNKSQLHTFSTVEYELYALWQSHQLQQEIIDFYVDEFPRSAIERLQRDYLDNPWSGLQREIAFTANDAVVVLSDGSQQQILLLLRLVGTRWKIYQETAL